MSNTRFQIASVSVSELGEDSGSSARALQSFDGMECSSRMQHESVMNVLGTDEGNCDRKCLQTSTYFLERAYWRMSW